MNKIRYRVVFLMTFLMLTGMSIAVQADAKSPTTTPQIETITGVKVNINTASASELASKLIGVGASKAKNIIEYRDKYGEFISINQLLEVSGIGPSILEKNRELLILK